MAAMHRGGGGVTCWAQKPPSPPPNVFIPKMLRFERTFDIQVMWVHGAPILFPPKIPGVNELFYFSPEAVSGGMFARCATFVLSILSLAPSLSTTGGPPIRPH